MTSTKGGSTLQSRTYVNDLYGNRTSETDESSDTTTYAFDALNRLTASSDGHTFGYDGDGRLTSDATSAGTTTFGWDPLDQLDSIDTPTDQVDYSHDALGRTATRDDGSAETSTHFADLSDTPAFDADPLGAITATYLDGPAGLTAERRGSQTDYLLSDARGDITAVTDASGAVSSRQSFDPWGEQLSGPAREFGFLGAFAKRTDPATDSVEMGARTYLPATGAFASPDPVMGATGKAGTFNRYSYALGDPTGTYDLSGLSPGYNDGPAVAGATNGMPRADGAPGSAGAAYGSAIAERSPQKKDPCAYWDEGADDGFVADAFNLAIGYGDSRSMGLSNEIRGLMGTSENVGYCSDWYRYGEIGGMATGGVPGIAKTAVRSFARKAARGGGGGGYSPTRIGKIAQESGRSPREVRDAIHKAKRNLPRGTKKKNPDVHVDDTGEIYPIGPGGSLGDSIGNIHD